MIKLEVSRIIVQLFPGQYNLWMALRKNDVYNVAIHLLKLSFQIRGKRKGH